MAKYYYPAIFERDEETKTYTVTFPDLQGCITQGENLEDASEMAKEAVGVYFDGIREKDFPAPVDVENLTMKKNQVLMLVEFDKTAYDRKYNSKAVKKTAQCKTLWDFGFRTYDARLKSMIFRNRYSSSAMP